MTSIGLLYYYNNYTPVGVDFFNAIKVKHRIIIFSALTHSVNLIDLRYSNKKLKLVIHQSLVSFNNRYSLATPRYLLVTFDMRGKCGKVIEIREGQN